MLLLLLDDGDTPKMVSVVIPSRGGSMRHVRLGYSVV